MSRPLATAARLLALGLTGALAGLPAAHAAWQWEAGVASESAGQGRSDRHEAELTLRRGLGPQAMVEAGLRQVRRGDVADDELALGARWPLGTAASLGLALQASPGATLLARRGARADLALQLGDGWVGQLGAGRRLYQAGGSSSLSLGIERYLPGWRLAAGVSHARLDGGASGAGLRLQVDRYFADERGRIGLLAARGRELEGLAATAGSGADVLDQRVSTLALLGAWPLGERWTLSGGLARIRYDDARRGLPGGLPRAYDATRVSLGVTHRH